MLYRNTIRVAGSAAECRIEFGTSSPEDTVMGPVILLPWIVARWCHDALGNLLMEADSRGFLPATRLETGDEDETPAPARSTS